MATDGTGRWPTHAPRGTTGYAEAALHVIDGVPPGRATTYGDVAEVMLDAGWGGGPRSVGAVMARHGDQVAWWRVVRADGRMPSCDAEGALSRHQAEGTALTAAGRVDLVVARARLPVAPSPRGAPRCPEVS